MSTDRLNIAREILKRRTVPTGLFPSEAAVADRLASAEPLTLYAGFDPTAPDIHIGNSIALLLLKALARDLGHTVVVLFGDFTARIGDPTGKDAVRRVLSAEEIEENTTTWDAQIATIFGDVPFTIRRNSEWSDRMTFADLIKLSARVTVQQMISRDMFQERLKHERPIHLNEFLYPLAQGYDSVAMRVDGEVGGSDQIFNMLVGREFSKELLGKDKLVIATPLLVDPKSGKKMSKSEGGLISVQDSPQEIRRKVLDIDDGLIRTVFQLCTEVPQSDIDAWQPEGRQAEKPREAKEALARELIRMYHGASAVGSAQQATGVAASGPLDRVLKDAGIAASLGEAKRLIEQGGVQINGVRAERWDAPVKPGDEIKVGKGKFLKAE